MRPTIILLTLSAAVTVSAQDAMSETRERYFFRINNPTPCSDSGCRIPCGKGQCQFGLTCGTWLGQKDTCCRASHNGKDLGCEPWKDGLENFDLRSGGSAAIRTAQNAYCTDDQNFLLTDQTDSTRNYCCPFGQDAIISVKYDDKVTSTTLNGARCIPAVSGASTNSDSTTVTGTRIPSWSLPNTAGQLQNIFVLVPVAFMVFAAL
ncbi:hypothetical protein H072_7671 [Dactylellina haptotyla CBS 200.50]|uniref:Uncharacterized protein n=1 Tax=Dactylellina haptotyla (strain CBS 200.50) TaxID=1284197 RepID=S8A6A5_DACHA|nr:hypothetical protein H072_7671 [Dactylellina haptotyla CBS 200.50]